MLLENKNFIKIGDYYLIKIPKDAYNIDVTTSGMLWFNRTTHTTRRFFYLPCNFSFAKNVIGRTDTMSTDLLNECGLTDAPFNDNVYLVCEEKIKFKSDIKLKTASITLGPIKKSDAWHELGSDLGFTYDKIRDVFEYGEFANLQIVVDENLNIVGGRIIPHKTLKDNYLPDEEVL